jgi:thiol-disulfide isomerase/thioredoxin
MKKVFMLLLAFGAVYQLSAQQWVSTTPQNKNVVLEEFTGIHCGYCPDGHKRASDLQKANPGRVVLINIHAGGYASPSAGEPDFRTVDGNAINTANGVTSFPNGSVNRINTPWGQSRSTWAADAADVMAESSPVNVYVKGYVDLSTRELTTEVEIYYTANSAQSTNYLTVGLLQNQVLGYQSDYGNFNPDNWVGDLYIHSHILRDVFTAALGDVIDTTTAGHYIYKKFVTTLPDDIAGVDLSLANLEVYAFVSETSSDIYTGHVADVEFDQSLVTDLELTNTTVLPSDYCFTSINPTVEVKNVSDKTITGFDVSVTIDGVEHVESFSGSLGQNETTTIDWGTINYTAKGNFSIDFQGFENVNAGTLSDINIMNNGDNISGIGFTDKAESTFYEDFETGSLQDHGALDPSREGVLVIRKGTSTKYGALNSSASIRISLHSSWGISGQPQNIIFGEVDLTSVSNPYLVYYFAYQDGGYGGTAPHVKLEVSTDCGQTWTVVRDQELSETGTPPTPGYYYVPKSEDYVWVGTSLKDYEGQEVLVKVSAIPGTTGNSVYLDEIILSTETGIVENAGDNGMLNMYPNPIENEAVIEFTVSDKSTTVLSVIDALGQVVLSENMGEKSKGLHTINMDFSSLESGIYFIKLEAGNQLTTHKFIKK